LRSTQYKVEKYISERTGTSLSRSKDVTAKVTDQKSTMGKVNEDMEELGHHSLQIGAQEKSGLKMKILSLDHQLTMMHGSSTPLAGIHKRRRSIEAK
jgi:hypothetical protein